MCRCSRAGLCDILIHMSIDYQDMLAKQLNGLIKPTVENITLNLNIEDLQLFKPPRYVKNINTGLLQLGFAPDTLQLELTMEDSNSLGDLLGSSDQMYSIQGEDCLIVTKNAGKVEAFWTTAAIFFKSLKGRDPSYYSLSNITDKLQFLSPEGTTESIGVLRQGEANLFKTEPSDFFDSETTTSQNLVRAGDNSLARRSLNIPLTEAGLQAAKSLLNKHKEAHTVYAEIKGASNSGSLGFVAIQLLRGSNEPNLFWVPSNEAENLPFADGAISVQPNEMGIPEQHLTQLAISKSVLQSVEMSDKSTFTYRAA